MIGHCIICKADNKELTDEHVIPDAIKGHYHIQICKDCNSFFGDHVDNHLLNNFIIKLIRFAKKLQGKTGSLPNPFGTGAMEDGTKVRIDNKEGVLAPYIIPVVEHPSEGKQGHILLDKVDEARLEGIESKMQKRAGEGMKLERLAREDKSIDKSWISTQEVIDLNAFKYGMLKIALEYTMAEIPAYENDPEADHIIDILRDGNPERVNEIKLIGNGFADVFEHATCNMIDFSNTDRHYLMLLGTDLGLICYVNLFNSLKQGFLMSREPYLSEEEMLILINDINKDRSEKYGLLALLEEYQKQGHPI